MFYMYIPPNPSDSSGFPGSPAGCVGDALPLKPANCQLRWMAFELNGNMTGWWCNNHLEKYESHNHLETYESQWVPDDNPYKKWNIIQMFER